jgi:hypothetical protein
MAKVTITLTDNGDSVDFSMKSEPPFSNESNTCAQYAAVKMLDAFTKLIEEFQATGD